MLHYINLQSCCGPILSFCHIFLICLAYCSLEIGFIYLAHLLVYYKEIFVFKNIFEKTLTASSKRAQKKIQGTRGDPLNLNFQENNGINPPKCCV